MSFSKKLDKWMLPTCIKNIKSSIADLEQKIIRQKETLEMFEHDLALAENTTPTGETK